ncbi:hypothetical protein HPB47_024264 [Ixodes persulcatus]|uniref:Uncharacterized protein n=1 Tax=Ixodes persulcatus TaxID=34615 RepID=A0AC60Q6Q6_IXOPE|nr:hypothetical protein HPB47_024264 [Ixodes persulcatus]
MERWRKHADLCESLVPASVDHEDKEDIVAYVSGLLSAANLKPTTCKVTFERRKNLVLDDLIRSMKSVAMKCSLHMRYPSLSSVPVLSKSHALQSQLADPVAAQHSRRMYCSVPFCKSDRKRKLGISFHEFPANDDRRQTWLKAISRKDFVPNDKSSSSVVCSLHFADSDYTLGSTKLRRLKRDAVPSIISGYPTYMHPQKP